MREIHWDDDDLDVLQTCLRKPAPNALVTLRRPFTLSLTMHWLSFGCSLLILKTSCIIEKVQVISAMFLHCKIM